ncbi:PilZ domain-containing protein [Neobacillus sp. OS1-2]|uniref:PilZ domain-containing protein n=1 Tax=Neobacillus sp. OS1-2 TaxID=3070680 RepID=UPI0035A64D92
MHDLFSRREFNRVKFNRPIQSSIESVTSIFKEKTEPTNEVTIYALDMSAGGIRFVSKVEFMINFLTTYRVKITISGRELVLYGKIIRKRDLINNIFEYGLQFNYSYHEQKV